MVSIPLIEEAYCPDIFISGIGRIEKLEGGLVRIVYYAERRRDGGEIERITAARMVRPIATWPQCIQMMAHAMSAADLVLVADGGEVRALN